MFGSVLGSVWVKFRSGSLSGQPCLGQGPFGSGEARVRVTYGYHVRVGTGSVRVEFRLGLFCIIYSSLVQIGYASSVIWVGWDSVQCLGQHRIRYKSNRV